MRLLPLFLFLAATPLHAAPPEQWLAAPQPWDRSLGSHRVILQVPSLPPGARAVSASIEWRRPDPAPEKKAVIIHDLKSGKPIPNVRIDHLSAESTQLTFDPLSGPGEYAVYFLPVQLEGGAFPVGKYLPPATSADAAWLKDHAASPAVAASPIRWEAVSAHDAWTAAEVIASAAELAALRTASGNLAAAIVPKDARSFRMNHTLSRDLALAGTTNTPIRLSARPGESLVFPVVIWSPDRDLSGVTAAFSGPATWLNPASIVCLSTHRTDWNGIASVVPASVPRATPKALWFAAPIPNEPGRTSLTLNLPLPDGSPATRTLTLEIEASGPPIADHGDSDPQSLSRLR
jgi:alkylhydroperoxidase family enzyme